MHPYASDSRSGHLIHLVLAVSAILAAWGLHAVFEACSLTAPWWVEMPSVLGFYGLLWKAFDLKLWTLKPLHWRNWLGVPDLNGNWNALIDTTYEGEAIQVEGQVVIRQTWSRVSIVAEWGKSGSYSATAVLQKGPALRDELTYTYVNEPKGTAVATMAMHRGTTWLSISEDRTRMEGRYYSGRGRQQFGDISLERA